MSSLDVFTLPPVDYRYEAHRFVRYNPTLTGIDPITFAIAQTDDWVDLADSRLEITVRLNHPHTGYEGLKMEDGTASTATVTRNTLVSNNFAHTLFKQMDLSLNGVLVTPQGNNYHHLAMLQTLTEYSRTEGKSKLAAQGWVNELNLPRTIEHTSTTDDHPKTGEMSTIAPLSHALTSKLQQKRFFTFVMRPYLPVFTSGRLLVPNVELKLDLHLNPSSHLFFQTDNLSTAATRKLPIITADDIKVTLILKKVTLNASVYLELQEKRTSGKSIVHYPVVRGDIRTFSIPTGFTRWEQDNIFLGGLPDEVILAFMHSNAYNGDPEYNTFAYERLGIIRVSQTVNGEEYPYKPLELSNTANNKGSTDYKGYERLLTSLAIMHNNKEPMILPEDWGDDKKCTIFYFNNVPGGNPNDPTVRNPRQSGNVRYTVDFAAATSHNITVLVYSSMEHDLRINYQNGVQYDVQA